ncbi:hypothetical protein [Kitasatospora herbaricolor]|uniref:hypothetical protein n=1 Tax=Kitasatospora herbaricolor TaxID=68217 RepID=UPI0039A4DF4B
MVEPGGRIGFSRSSGWNRSPGTGDRGEGETGSDGGLREALAPLLADPVRREAMAARSREHGRPDAAERLVDVVLAAASGR